MIASAKIAIWQLDILEVFPNEILAACQPGNLAKVP